MKKKMLAGTSFAIAAVILLGGASFKFASAAHAADSKGKASVQVSTNVKTNHDLKHLSAMGFVLDDNLDQSTAQTAGSATTPAIIDSNAAIEHAKKAFPGWANDAKNVTAEYHIVTNLTYQGLPAEALAKNPKLAACKKIDKTPAYIVSFTGMTYVGHVPMNYKGQAPVHHEYNVLIDATTGEPLMGFSYR